MQFGFPADIFTEKDFSALAEITVRYKTYERTGKPSSTKNLGLNQSTQGEKGGGPLETEAGVSFSQSEVSTPRPVTGKDLLTYEFKSWFGRSILRDDDTVLPVPFNRAANLYLMLASLSSLNQL